MEKVKSSKGPRRLLKDWSVFPRKVRQRELGLSRYEKKRLRGILIHEYKYLRAGAEEGETGFA